ncbi:MAG: ArnT family glycosyltransferase [Chthonomonadales bacterium]
MGKASAARAHWAAGVLIAAAAGVQAYLAWALPLAADETYYWEWSRHLGWGYYDQGPMIAWWIRASTALLGDGSLGIRAGIVLAAAGTHLLVYLLGLQVAAPRVALRALVLSIITPLSFAGGFIATYDPLLVFFWSGAITAGLRALGSSGFRWWVFVGVLWGLGLLSKHSMALFALCLGVALLHPDWRHWFRRPQPWVALVVGVAVFLPNLIWQSFHHWMTFRHLFLLTAGDNHTPWRRLGEYIGSQAGLISPLLFAGFVASLIYAMRRGWKLGEARVWYLFSMAAPVLVFFCLLALKSKVQANWAVMGWVSVPLVYALWLEDAAREERRGKLVTILDGAAVAVCCMLTLLLVAPELRTAMGMRVPARWDQTNKLFGGREIADAAERAKRMMEAEGAGPVVLAAATYDTASRMAYYMRGKPHVACIFVGTRMNSYVLWNKEAHLVPGSNAVIVDGCGPSDACLPPFRAIFHRVVYTPPPVLVYRPGVYRQPVDRLYVYRCYGYHPNKDVERPKGG